MAWDWPTVVSRKRGLGRVAAASAWPPAGARFGLYGDGAPVEVGVCPGLIPHRTLDLAGATDPAAAAHRVVRLRLPEGPLPGGVAAVRMPHRDRMGSVSAGRL